MEEGWSDGSWVALQRTRVHPEPTYIHAGKTFREIKQVSLQTYFFFKDVMERLGGGQSRKVMKVWGNTVVAGASLSLCWGEQCSWGWRGGPSLQDSERTGSDFSYKSGMENCLKTKTNSSEECHRTIY